ncbi:MAG: hypothetical protein KJ002_14915, partial [Candidatus Dadabacteria bacterium]|nr:hypothetical protein [Candidatus Dadabacteria bacterium]
MRRMARTHLFVLLILLAGAFVPGGRAADAMDAADLPAPQLVTGAWMFMAAYKADPEALKALLPEGLETTGNIVINMYTVPEAAQTSGF